MTIRTILTPYHGQQKENAALETAINLAKDRGASVTCQHISIDPYEFLYPMDASAAAAVGQSFREHLQEEADSRASKAHGHFVELCNEHHISCAKSTSNLTPHALWVRDAGDVARCLTRRAKMHDVVVVCRDIAETNYNYDIVFHATLFDSGRPLIIVPPRKAVKHMHTVAIAWDGSAPATRAISAALPLLRNALEVVVLRIGEVAENNPDIENLEAYLSAHGISITAISLKDAGTNMGDQITRAAATQEADIIIMGAYAHSRLRQMISGSVTRHMIHHASMAVFMMH